MSQLIDLGIVQGRKGVTLKIFEEVCPDIFALPQLKPSQFVTKLWSEYQASPFTKSNNINGTMFEYILAAILIRHNLRPFHRGVKMAFIPNIEHDLILITTQKQVISLSAKTSLRERYKQADLEAMALKNVHRKSLCYLLTLETHEAQVAKQKIKAGDALALDDVILVNDSEFDHLIDDLSKFSFIENHQTSIVLQSRMVK
ncbi:MAG: hypothetical protein GX295_05790 [Syntrophomonadaceae bacterium]|nr:hypothetical protein [Syntrophomonadaceae bacterium]